MSVIWNRGSSLLHWQMRWAGGKFTERKEHTHTPNGAVNTWKESLAELVNLLKDPSEWHRILFRGSLPENSPGF